MSSDSLGNRVLTNPAHARSYHLTIVGCILTVFSLFMLSLAQPGHFYQPFLAQGVGLGLGSGLTYIPSVAVLAQHFPGPYERALVMMVVASGSSMGGLVHPIMLNNLFHKKNVGFAKGVRASAGLLAGMLFIAVLCMRARYAPHAPLGTKGAATGGTGTESVSLKKTVKKFSRDFVYVIAVLG